MGQEGQAANVAWRNFSDCLTLTPGCQTQKTAPVGAMQAFARCHLFNTSMTLCMSIGITEALPQRGGDLNDTGFDRRTPALMYALH
jgi:hypothetical protein